MLLNQGTQVVCCHFEMAMDEHGRDDANWVSLWVGRCPSQQELSRSVLATYDENGDSGGSPFSSAFETGHMDEDFMECFAFPATKEVSSALAGCSDEQALISALRRVGLTSFDEVVDCAVLVFHFRHHAPPGVHHTVSSVELTFLGSFQLE